MKKNIFKTSVYLAIFCGTLSCVSVNKSMREPNSRVNFKKSDFAFSPQLTDSATTTRVFGIDWRRILSRKAATVRQDRGVNSGTPTPQQVGGSIILPRVPGPINIILASIPVIGTAYSDRTSSYALYNMMQRNPGYDVVFYPAFETQVRRPLGLGLIWSVTTVKVNAKLAKIKETDQ